MNFIQRIHRTLRRRIKIASRKMEAAHLGIQFVAPNCLYLPRFNAESTVIDAGCGFNPELSLHLIEKYGVRAYGVDPTLKHVSDLRTVEQRTKGRFKHLQLAITARDGTITFHESNEHESGSILDDHTNVRRDQIKTYEIESVSLSSLLKRMDLTRADYLKLDLEGAEYALLGGITADDLAPFGQVFVEFHHHATQQYSEVDTRRMVERIKDMGFQSFSLDDHNYLFYR